MKLQRRLKIEELSIKVLLYGSFILSLLLTVLNDPRPVIILLATLALIFEIVSIWVFRLCNTSLLCVLYAYLLNCYVVIREQSAHKDRDIFCVVILAVLTILYGLKKHW